jgi:hypothetical protein
LPRTAFRRPGRPARKPNKVCAAHVVTFSPRSTGAASKPASQAQRSEGLEVSAIKGRKTRLASISFGPDHSLAAHRQAATKLCKTRPRAELGHEDLPFKAVATLAGGAFQYDDGASNVLYRRPVAAAEVLPSSRHLISYPLGFTPDRPLLLKLISTCKPPTLMKIFQ